MAIAFNVYTVGTPTGLAAAAAAGGNLAVGTTYYYRVIAVRRVTLCSNPVIYGFAFSTPGAEVSATPDLNNRTINLSWIPVENAWGYIVQRTITAGSYPCEGKNSLRFTNQYWTEFTPTGTSNTAIADNGGASGNIGFDSANFDYCQAIPVIEAYGTGKETLKLSQIYNASVSGGWGVVETIGPPGFKTSATGSYADNCPYIMYAHLHLRDCELLFQNMLITIGGGFSGYNVKFTANRNFSYLLRLCARVVGISADDGTTITRCETGRTIYLKDASSVDKLLVRNLYGDKYFGTYYDGYTTKWQNYANSTIKNSLLNQQYNASEPCFAGANICGNTWENYAPVSVNMSDQELRYGQYNRIIGNNVKTIRFKTVAANYSSTNNDTGFGWAFGAAEEDCTWRGRSQIDGKPYLCIYCQPNGVGKTYIKLAPVKIQVVNQNGTPMTGVEIQLHDWNGNSALFLDSGATFSSALNNSDITSNLAVSDGSKFSPGDIIRLATYSELMQVEKINGNTLTVSRGYGATAKRASGVNSTGDDRILKQQAKVTTDENGQIGVESILYSELVIVDSVSGYYTFGFEDDLVSQGKLQRNTGKFTLLVTPAGYGNFEKVFDIEGKINVRLYLSELDEP